MEQLAQGKWHRMRHNTSKNVFAYWNRLRAGRPAPDRCEIEPSDIREFLGDTFILEIDRQYQAITFRLAGTRLCGSYCRELKGVGFLGLWSEDDNLNIANAIRGVYQENKACTLGAMARTECNNFVEYEFLLLPLCTSQQDSIRILGVATPRKTDYWLGTTPLVENQLNSVRFSETDGSGSTDENSFADTVAALKQKSLDRIGGRKVKHLMVLQGGKETRKS